MIKEECYRFIFENDKSGSKRRLGYLIKRPEVLHSVQSWCEKYGLNSLTLEEKVYHYFYKLTNLPLDLKNGYLLKYKGFKKGYSKTGFIRTQKRLDDIKIDINLQKNGASVSQKILNDESLFNELIDKYPYNISVRGKVYMFINKLTSIPKCKNCSNDTRFGDCRGFFLESCSEDCRRTLEQKPRSSYIKFGSRIVRTQGYEQFVLEELLKSYSADDILVSDEFISEYGSIHYGNKSYRPDIYIKSINKIIEVKSSWTYKLDFEKNKEKQKACIEQGFNFEFHIWDLKQII